MKIGSLFSGIGGLELGLERSGIGSVVWQVELDPFRRGVLAKHWPNARRYEDVRTVGKANLAPVDIICGGFPCQDVSSAGKRAGLAGSKSGLWYEFLRVVNEMLPRMVVIENVASGATKWVDPVRGDLERAGYSSLPIPVAAADCGAFHLRKRVFLLAHLDRYRKPIKPVHEKVGGNRRLYAHVDEQQLRIEQGWSGRPEGEDQEIPTWANGSAIEPSVVRLVHGVPDRLASAKISALGDAVMPQCSEVVGYFISSLMEATL